MIKLLLLITQYTLAIPLYAATPLELTDADREEVLNHLSDCRYVYDTSIPVGKELGSLYLKEDRDLLYFTGAKCKGSQTKQIYCSNNIACLWGYSLKKPILFHSALCPVNEKGSCKSADECIKDYQFNKTISYRRDEAPPRGVHRTGFEWRNEREDNLPTKKAQ